MYRNGAIGFDLRVSITESEFFASGPFVSDFSFAGPAMSTGARLTPRYQQMIALP
jgi:hypothetical protein